MYAVCYFLVFVVICVLSIPYNEPTPEEIAKGFVVKPWASWGQQARQQNSLRILCIGGSNTAHDYKGLGYVNLLNSFVKSNLSDDEYFREHSYAWNRGVSGLSILEFTGRLYNFELNNSFTEWPNVVILDGSVNMPGNLSRVVQGLELLMRSIVFKYNLRGFPPPDIMFYNMPHLRPLYSLGHIGDRSTRKKIVASYRAREGLFEPDTLIKRFATFYHFPIISWGEAAYDAAMRHFTEVGSMKNWHFSEDGVHMAPSGGTQFGMHSLLAPFFRGVMKTRKEGELKDAISQWPRMYPASPALIEVLSFTSYSYSVNIFELTDAIHNLEESQWKKIHITHADYCFGSTERKSMGELRFTAPSICKTLDCRVKVQYLHSWNTSYIGDAVCNLSHGGSHLGNVTIIGHDESNGATIPVESVFQGVSVKEGLHVVRCHNLIEDRLSCMTALNVNAIVVV